MKMKKIIMSGLFLAITCMTLPAFAMTKEEFQTQSKAIREETKAIQAKMTPIQQEIKAIQDSWKAITESKKSGNLTISKENFQKAKELRKGIKEYNVKAEKTPKDYNAENKELRKNGQYEKVLANLKEVQNLKKEKYEALLQREKIWKEIAELIK